MQFSCTKYQVVTQFTEATSEDDEDGEQESVNYLINAELRKCTKAARNTPNNSYNFEVQLVTRAALTTSQSDRR